MGQADSSPVRPGPADESNFFKTKTMGRAGSSFDNPWAHFLRPGPLEHLLQELIDPRRFNLTIGSDRNPTRLHKDPVGIPVVDRHSDHQCRNSTEPIGGFDRPLKLAPGTIFLQLIISSRGRSKATDRFRRIPILGSHRIPTLGIRMSVHSPESDRIRCRIL